VTAFVKKGKKLITKVTGSRVMLETQLVVKESLRRALRRISTGMRFVPSLVQSARSVVVFRIVTKDRTVLY
jgi:hypothetical protein